MINVNLMIKNSFSIITNNKLLNNHRIKLFHHKYFEINFYLIHSELKVIFYLKEFFIILKDE